MPLKKQRILKKFLVSGSALISSAICPTLAQNSEPTLPVVTNLSIPSYPRIAVTVHIQGLIKMQVITNGKKVLSFHDESGPPLLVHAAEENLRTWEFQGGTPGAFTVTFEYRLENTDECNPSGESTAILQLPSRVVITAKAVSTCDPISVRRAKRHWYWPWK